MPVTAMTSRTSLSHRAPARSGPVGGAPARSGPARAALAGAVLSLCVLVASGCTAESDAPDGRGANIDVTTMRGALLQAAEIGPTWTAPRQSQDPQQLVSICGGGTAAPSVPPGASTVVAPLVDEGTEGAQTLDQTALVYGDATGAVAGLAALRAVADGCPPSVSIPRNVSDTRSEPAYTESVSTTDLSEGGWTGFVVVRHKQYEPKHPGVADTAVAVLQKRNVVLMEAYAVYRLGASSRGPQFDADWKKLVGTVLNRVG